MRTLSKEDAQLGELALAIMSEPQRDRDVEDEPRFNANHDGKGKFAKNSGSKWTVEDRASLEKQATAETWVLIDGPDGADLRASHSQAELESMVKEQVSLIVPADPGVTLRSGDMALHLSAGLSVPVTDQHKELLTRRMAELAASAPVKGAVNVSVVPQAHMSAENVRGMTQRGTGRIFLSEEIFRDGAQQHDPGFMPSYKDKGVVDYTLTHEWGHARDNLSDGDSIKAWGESMDGVSTYGLFSHREAFAEAFAEWNLSGGQTSNPSARAYAERYGW